MKRTVRMSKTYFRQKFYESLSNLKQLKFKTNLYILENYINKNKYFEQQEMFGKKMKILKKNENFPKK